MTTKRTVIAVMTVLCCLAIGVAVYAQGGDVESRIKQLQKESTKAQMNNDVSWAEQHLADGFVAGHSWGQWQNKNEFIKELQDKRTNGKAAISAT